MDFDKIKDEREKRFDNKVIEKIAQKSILNKSFKYLWSFLPVILLCTIIVVLFLASMAKKDKINAARLQAGNQDIKLVNVVAMNVVPKKISERLNLPGKVKPWKELTVLTEVSGMVLKKNVKEGDVVRQGDLLALIDSSKYRSIYNSAKATYASALANKNRIEALYKKNLSNKADYDLAISNMESAKSNMRIAQIDFEKCRVVAPISGTVNNLYFEDGQFLPNGSKVVKILQTEKLKVTVGIPESDMVAVRDLNHFKIEVEALGGKEFIGRKYYLSKTTENQAQLYDLVIEVDNTDGDLLPDMFTRVEIIKRTVPSAVTLPLYSIISSSDKHIVYVLDNNVAKTREVSLGIQEGLEIEIAEGISAGEQVVVRGQRSLNNGQKVKLNRLIKSIKELN